MQSIQILWVDDEIELLKSHILFLASRGYETKACNNGQEALELINLNSFDVILLDENMPGLNGLETLSLIKETQPGLPVIMVTKNEEERIMEKAIGSKISDYLIKPVNPHQILSSLKKILNHQDLISERTSLKYQKEFQKIALELHDLSSAKQWSKFFQKMTFWELELEQLEDKEMLEIFISQYREANILFAKFVENNYRDWINNSTEDVLLSHQLFKERVIPVLSDNCPTLLLVIDNLRYDQWKTIEPYLLKYYNKKNEEVYFSILPTCTQYARNSIFAGLTPLEIKTHLPHYWRDDHEEGGKNLFEAELLESLWKRLLINGNQEYTKITDLNAAKKVSRELSKNRKNKLTTVVYNFVDMISHAKSEMEIIKELASDNKAYRSLTESWFKNSPLIELIQTAQKEGFNLIITTDHGTINVDTAVEVIGDRETSSNLRYKTGKNLKYPNKKAMEVFSPEEIKLPKNGINSSYIFAKESNYFVYPKNFNHYANIFLNSYQHGGISMEEMMIPFVFLTPK